MTSTSSITSVLFFIVLFSDDVVGLSESKNTQNHDGGKENNLDRQKALHASLNGHREFRFVGNGLFLFDDRFEARGRRPAEGEAVYKNEYDQPELNLKPGERS